MLEAAILLVKLGTVLEEADEAAECMALTRDGKLATSDDVRRLSQESHELRLIFAKATRTARANEERQAREREIERRKTRKRTRACRSTMTFYLSPSTFYLAFLPFTFYLALLI